MDNLEQPSNVGENSSDRETSLPTLDISNDEFAQGVPAVHTPHTAPTIITSASSLYEDLRSGTSNLKTEKKRRDVTRDTSSTRPKSTLDDTKFGHVLSRRGTESPLKRISSTSFDDDSSNRTSSRKPALKGSKYHRVLYRGGSDSTDSSRRPAPSPAMNDNSDGKTTLEHAGDLAPLPRRASDVANNGGVLDVDRYYDMSGAFSIDAYENETRRQATRTRAADDEESPPGEAPSLQPDADIPVDRSTFLVVEAQAIDDLAIAEVTVNKWYNRRAYRFLMLGGVFLASSLLVIVIVLLTRPSASVSATPTPAPVANSQIPNDANPVSRPTPRPTKRPTTRPVTWDKVDPNAFNPEIMGDTSSALNADGSVVAIGFTRNTFQYRGRVYVYKLTNVTEGSQQWSSMGLELDGVNVSDSFGTSVALSGDGNVLAVGATQVGMDDNGNFVTVGGGYVSVFSFQEARGWIPRGAPVRAGLNTSDGFGYDVALSLDGMVLAVLATNFPFSADTPVGYAKIFHFNATSLEWDLVDRLEKWSGSGDMSMSLSGDGSVIAVGDTFDGISGSIHAWSCDVATGCERIGQEIIGEDYEDMIGRSVSLSENGEILAAGSPGNYDCAWNTPSCVNVKVYRFVRGSNPAWTRVGQRLTGEMGFGRVLKISGDGASMVIHVPVCRLVDGCSYASESDYDSVIQLYRLNATSAWVKVGLPVKADLQAFSSDGSMIAASDFGYVSCYQLDE